MPDRATHRSLSRAVYAGLRADILTGRYAPGARLSPRAVATESEPPRNVPAERGGPAGTLGRAEPDASPAAS